MAKRLYLAFIILGIVTGIFVTLIVNEYSYSGNQVQEEELKVLELQANLEQGKKAYYQGDFKLATQYYYNALQQQPDHLTALKNIAMIKTESGELAEALSYNHRLITLLPDNLFWRYKYGVNLFKSGNFTEAGTQLQAILNKLERPGNSQTGLEPQVDFNEREEAMLLYFLGKTSLQLGNKVNAEKYFQAGIGKASYLTLNYLALADFYQLEEKTTQAIKYYKAALARDSSQSNLYPELANLYEELDEEEAAYYYWQKSLVTGNSVKLARQKIKLLEKEHPGLVEETEERKKEERKKIKWVKVEPVEADPNIPILRIGLINKVSSLAFQSGSAFQVFSEQKEILNGLAGEEWKIHFNGSEYHFYRKEQLIKKYPSVQPLQLKLKEQTATFVIYDISYGKGYFWAGNEDRQYRGQIEILPQNSYFNVINLINLEEYLFSVLPSEMPAWWPEEALKAQVVAARSYALVHLGRHRKDGYNLCATVHCAVYNGVKSEHKRTNQAVLATKGEVATYQGRIIDAVFSSNSGGITESSAEVWGNKHAYLSGSNTMVKEELIFPLEPYKLEEWLLKEPASYSNIKIYAGYNKYRWVKYLPVDYLQEKYQLTAVKDIIARGRTSGGGVKKVVLVGEDKEITISGGKIRSALGGLKSNRFTIEKIHDQDGLIEEIIFLGSGWGHNVGMDQTGAAGMAEHNINYQEILKHFYQGIEITKKY